MDMVPTVAQLSPQKIDEGCVGMTTQKRKRKLGSWQEKGPSTSVPP